MQTSKIDAPAFKIMSDTARYYAGLFATKHSVSREDLEQQAWVLMLEAWPKYDPTRARLNTYMSMILRRYLLRAALHDAATVTLPNGHETEVYNPRMRGAQLDKPGSRGSLHTDEPRPRRQLVVGPFELDLDATLRDQRLADAHARVEDALRHVRGKNRPRRSVLLAQEIQDDGVLCELAS